MSMEPRPRDVIAAALKEVTASWRTFAITDLAYKLLAAAILTPATALLLRWLLWRTGSRVVADADIARFFITTPSGIVALLAGSVLLTAIAAVECACLMALANGVRDAKSAIAFGAVRAGPILRLAFHMVVRVIAGLLPFAAALFAVYAALLREHDINYYLTHKPPAFVAAAVLACMLGGALIVLCVRTVIRWALALPLLLFENVSPRHALRVSAERSEGHGILIGMTLAIWAVTAIAAGAAAGALVAVAAELGGPLVAGSLAALFPFVMVLTLLWIVATTAAAIFNASVFSSSIACLWRAASGHARPRVAPEPVAALPRPIRWALILCAILFAAGVAMLGLLASRPDEHVLVIAHRGASTEAPENSLAAFRTAIAHRADYLELDVQETLDGEVIVAHDQDLMKLGRSPMKIWERTAAELRTVDIGRKERVPTLAEALAVARGTGSRVLIELKSYGHDDRLEERVAAIVESQGMADRCAYMSLDHDMVRTMKRLRPSWRVGALVAKTFGDPTSLGADFLAVEARMLTPALVRRAHRAGQDVYVWTVNDPAWMLAAASRGADGIITDVPGLAAEVLRRRRNMSDAERLLVAIFIRTGANIESLEREDALRP